MAKGRTWRKRQNKTEKATSLSHKQEYIALFQWAKRNGVVFHKMKPYIFPGTGRGLMATRRINAADLLISVPKRLLVTEQLLRHSYLGGLNPTNRPDLTTIDLLCLFLILEQSLGSKSFWFPYVSMLPTDFNTPPYFTHAEIKHAPGFFAEQSWSQLRSIRECFARLMKFVCCGDQMKNMKITFDDVRWAWNVVNTRSVHMNGKSSVEQDAMACALAPFLDLLNHSSDVQVEAGFSETEQSYEIYTKTTFKKGNQVFINYGPHSNRKLLMEYGFILPKNCHNSIKILPKLVYDVVSKHHRGISKKKYDFIAKYNLEETYFCSSNGLSWSLKTALEILSLNDTKLESRHIVIDDLQLSTENKALVRVFSREILKVVLDEYHQDITRILSNSGSKNNVGVSDRMKQLVHLLELEMNVVKNAKLSLQ